MCIVVWSRLSGRSSEWERGYHLLPQGYYRVVIEATSGKGTEHLNIAVDDIWIGQCERGRFKSSSRRSSTNFSCLWLVAPWSGIWCLVVHGLHLIKERLSHFSELVCKETATGKGYAGALQETRSGHQCEPWKRVPAQIRASVWTSQDPEIIEQLLPSLGNYCR